MVPNICCIQKGNKNNNEPKGKLHKKIKIKYIIKSKTKTIYLEYIRKNIFENYKKKKQKWKKKTPTTIENYGLHYKYESAKEIKGRKDIRAKAQHRASCQGTVERASK